MPDQPICGIIKIVLCVQGLGQEHPMRIRSAYTLPCCDRILILFLESKKLPAPFGSIMHDCNLNNTLSFRTPNGTTANQCNGCRLF